MKVQNCLLRGLRGFLFLAAACVAAFASTATVTTVAGGYIGDGKPARMAAFANPTAVARDGNGNVYVSDADNCRIRLINPAGIISTFAGTGVCGYSGDGGPAKAARIGGSYGIALDQHGDLFISDGVRIRKIAHGGTISTVAGNGTYGYSGDGGPATDATLNGALGVAVDVLGNFYIADTGNNVIRKVDGSGIIHTVAGNHSAGFSGDGGPATQASLNFPWAVVADAKGNFFISDINNYRVRKVDANGTINTYAGNGNFGNTGSGGPATQASIGAPSGLMLADGKLYLTTGLVWAVDVSTRIITIVAGNGNSGFDGDGKAALSTSFTQPYGIAADASGGYLVADSGNNRVRHVGADNIVTTFAGGNVNDGTTGAGSLDFWFEFPHMATDRSGNLYIADSGGCRVRKVSPVGTISTFAGTGICGYSGDGGAASAATISFTAAVVADDSGNVYIADTGNSVIRKVDTNGNISTFLTAFNYSGGSLSARVNALALDQVGNLYASDGLFAIWKVTPSGTTTIVAGVLFDIGYNGDNMPATQAWLDLPTGLAVDAHGNLYISDWLNNRIRKVDSSGTITTVAGNGTAGFSGDGGAATSATLNLPTDVAVDERGNLYIADWINFRIRAVNPSGVIRTFAGSGGFGFNGENIPAKLANMFPVALSTAPDGSMYFADQGSFRVRRVH